MNKRKLQNRKCKKIKETKCLLKNQKAITLIALVISIIIMLILAGVSLNATIGENGIITQAKKTSYMQSIAVLEEYLNNYYVENYENFESSENKAEALEKNYESSNWIWNPSKHGYGNLGYIVDSDGNMCYLINKSELPDEIKKQILGGEAGDGSYSDYAKLNDVYGVTTNLKVYYSDGNNMLGISKENLEKDNPLREIFEAGSSIAKIITGSAEKNVTLQDIKSVKTLTLEGNSGISNLSDLYNLTSLTELKLKDITYENLNGIQNALKLNYISFENCTIKDYSAMANNKNISSLYLINTNDEQVSLLCEGIEGVEFSKLQNFGIYNSPSVTNIKKLALLSNNTKESINKLYLSNNNIDDVEVLSDFTGVTRIELQYNRNLKTLKGLENMKNLSNLYAYFCNLGANEIYDTSLENNGKNKEIDALYSISELKNIEILSLRNNINLKWIEYISNYEKLSELTLANNENMTNESFVKIKDIALKLGSTKCNYPSKYSKLLNSDERKDLKDANLSNDSEEYLALLNNKNLKQLRLDGNTNLKDEGTYSLNNVLKTNVNLEVLSLKDVNISSIEFVKNLPNLKELDIRGTSVTDVSLLEDYCKNLKTLVVDNKDTDITKIQGIISNMNLGLTNVKGTFFTDSLSGLIDTSGKVYKKLEECTEITTLYIAGRALYESLSNFDIDLSKCTKLTDVYLDSIKLNIKYPENVKTVNISWRSAERNHDFSNCANITKLSIYSPSQNVMDFIVSHLGSAYVDKMVITYWYDTKSFKNISKNATINKLSIGTSGYIKQEKIENIDDLQNIHGLTELSISGCKLATSFLETTTFSDLTSLAINNTNFDNIKFVKNSPNLKYIAVAQCNVKSLSGIENCSELTEINFNNNAISSVIELQNLKKLSIIRMENNCLYDDFTYIDTDGNSKTCKNLEIFANMNKNSLKYLYLKGNSGIIDWTPVSEIKNWTGHSGW